MEKLFSTDNLISLALIAVLLIAGLASIFTRKVYLMGKSASKYTEESLRKYSLPSGIANIITAAGLALFDLLDKEVFSIGSFPVTQGLICLVALAVVATIILVASKKLLVKKEA